MRDYARGKWSGRDHVYLVVICIDWQRAQRVRVRACVCGDASEYLVCTVLSFSYFLCSLCFWFSIGMVSWDETDINIGKLFKATYACLVGHVWLIFHINVKWWLLIFSVYFVRLCIEKLIGVYSRLIPYFFFIFIRKFHDRPKGHIVVRTGNKLYCRYKKMPILIYFPCYVYENNNIIWTFFPELH